MPLSRRLAAFLLAVLTVVLLPVPARAAAGSVSGGRLDWGIKQSFLTYLTGPVAQGSWNLTGGTATVGGNVFRFHSAVGGYDPAAGVLEVSFSGGVHFTGHPQNGGYALDLTIAQVSLRAAQGGSAALYADVTSKAKDTGTVTRVQQTRLADLAMGGLDLRGAAGTLTISNVPATLTTEGAQAFGGFYQPGTALDPVSLSVNLAAQRAQTPAPPRSAAPSEAAGAPAATATTPASAPPSSDASPSPASPPPVDSRPSTAAQPPTPSPAASAPAPFTRGVLDWGVRRTFRDYVTGSIAQGRWELSQGAADGGAFFRWDSAHGGYDPAAHALTAAFAGQVRFTGRDLDLTLANPALAVADGRGTLRADVSGQPAGAPIATFDPGALTVTGGLLSATELPLQLTPEGAAAFGHRYPAGTAMDPLSFALALDPSAALPPLPDIGSLPSPSAPASPGPLVAQAGGGFPTVPTVIGLAAVLAAVAAAALIRRRARP